VINADSVCASSLSVPASVSVAREPATTRTLDADGTTGVAPRATDATPATATSAATSALDATAWRRCRPISLVRCSFESLAPRIVAVSRRLARAARDARARASAAREHFFVRRRARGDLTRRAR
jgi:hypothetical protein